jgi:hypothetical protein
MSNAGRCLTLIGLVALLLSVSGAHAEEPAALQPGARVRMLVLERSQAGAATHRREITGRLTALDDTTVSLEASPGYPPLVLSRDSIEAVEVSLRRGQRRKGAIIGGIVGAAVGVVVAVADDTSCPEPQNPGDLFGCLVTDEFNGPEWKAGFGLLAGAAGAGLGALVAPGEKWEAVSNDRLRVAVAPARGGGLRLGVSFSF